MPTALGPEDLPAEPPLFPRGLRSLLRDVRTAGLDESVFQPPAVTPPPPSARTS